jgi:hypothetical protein
MIGALGIGLVSLALSAAQQNQPPAVVGRWDLTVLTPTGRVPSWFEVRLSGNRTLVGQYVGPVGSARPISQFDFEGGVLRFSVPPQWETGNNELRFEARLEGDRLSGWMTDASGARFNWSASRAPLLRRATLPAWGTPIRLIGRTDLTGWVTPADNNWRVANGVLINSKAGGNLITRRAFDDFKLHVEFRYPAGGNSGVYLRGRHEVQIEDTRGREPASDHLGGIYGFIAPNQDAAGRAGEWQTFDITLVGRLVTVILNGKAIINNQLIPGITGGALDSNEGAPGPIMLQGDHGPVEFRNIILTPAVARGR